MASAWSTCSRRSRAGEPLWHARGVTSGTSDAADASPTRRHAVPRPPTASAPAGSLPPGSAPAVGWQGPVGPRLPNRTGRHGRPPEAVIQEPATGPFAVPSAQPLAEPSSQSPEWNRARSRRPAPRQPMLLQGVLPAVAAGVLALAAAQDVLLLAAGVLVVQVFLVLAFLALVDAPASEGAFVVAIGAALAADVLVIVHDGDVRGLAGVVGLALIASLVHQLVRRRRSRVTESIADTLVAVVLAVSVACLVSLRALDDGEETAVIALAAAAASLLAGRVGDRIVAQPVLAVGSTRGWPGLLLALGSGVAAAVLVAGDEGMVVGTQAGLFGLVCAATVAAADLSVDLGAAELRAGRRDARRVEALKPANLLMPFALLGPISLVAGHLVLG